MDTAAGTPVVSEVVFQSVHVDYCLLGGAENARLENAELENAAPNCRTGKRETGKRENGLVMESRSILNNRHTSRCYFKTDDCC